MDPQIPCGHQKEPRVWGRVVLGLGFGTLHRDMEGNTTFDKTLFFGYGMGKSPLGDPLNWERRWEI